MNKPDPTAVRVALWRALHVQIDSRPHVLEDEVGLLLAAPDAGWQQRPDMHPQGTSGYRAGIVARARLIEDLVTEQARAAGTPFRSFFTPAEISALALSAGFQKAEPISRDELVKRYFSGPADGLVPARRGVPDRDDLSAAWRRCA